MELLAASRTSWASRAILASAMPSKGAPTYKWATKYDSGRSSHLHKSCSGSSFEVWLSSLLIMKPVPSRPLNTAPFSRYALKTVSPVREALMPSMVPTMRAESFETVMIAWFSALSFLLYHNIPLYLRLPLTCQR